MKSGFLDTPPRLNMGFHYPLLYSRRTRVRVMGLVDQGSEQWERWYLRMHEPAAIQAIAAAGYTAIEIHFLYGFGLETEREEWERTRLMTRYAHEAGLKVFGYFQFFSVQQETFFLENPWATNCVQIDAEGRRIQYSYNRPALCFSHPRVRQYYFDGIELGLKVCDLDGIRLDNDYDNTNPVDLVVTIPERLKHVDCFMPEGLGPRIIPKIHVDRVNTTVEMERLHTYCVLRIS